MKIKVNVNPMMAWFLISLHKLQWFYYEQFVMRFYYAKDQASYAIACDEEANDHYGIKVSKLRVLRCFLVGFFDGLFVRHLPDHFIESWFQPVKTKVECLK
jgi:hypothetical protein